MNIIVNVLSCLKATLIELAGKIFGTIVEPKMHIQVSIVLLDINLSISFWNTYGKKNNKVSY